MKSPLLAGVWRMEPNSGLEGTPVSGGTVLEINYYNGLLFKMCWRWGWE